MYYSLVYPAPLRDLDCQPGQCFDCHGALSLFRVVPVAKTHLAHLFNNCVIWSAGRQPSRCARSLVEHPQLVPPPGSDVTDPLCAQRDVAKHFNSVPSRCYPIGSDRRVEERFRPFAQPDCAW